MAEPFFIGRKMRSITTAVVLVIIVAGNILFRSLPVFSGGRFEQSVIADINRIRLANGLKPLHASAKLHVSAALKIRDMQVYSYWAHVSPRGKQPWYFIDQASYSYSLAAENLAFGYSEPGVTVKAWYLSVSHRNTLLDPRLTEVGIAKAIVTLDGYDKVVVVAHFARPQAGWQKFIGRLLHNLSISITSGIKLASSLYLALPRR